MGIDIIGFFKEHKEEILGGLVLLDGAVLIEMSDGSGGCNELTNGQKLDLGEAVDAVRWNFGEDVEYVDASDGAVCFSLSDGGYETVDFSCSRGEWSAFYCGDYEDVKDAVQLILDQLN